jgi:hypothetical protein
LGTDRVPPRAVIASNERTFVSIKGSPYPRFRRARWPAATRTSHGRRRRSWAGCRLRTRSRCWLRQVGEEERHSRAAARWLGRLLLETPGATLADAQLAAAAHAGLPGPAAAEALAAVCTAMGRPEAAAVLRPGRPQCRGGRRRRMASTP